MYGFGWLVTYCVADAGMQHFDEVFVVAHLVEHDGGQLEACAGLVYHECHGLDVGEVCVFHDAGWMMIAFFHAMKMLEETMYGMLWRPT